MAQARKAAQQKKSGLQPFYYVLGGLALLGIGAAVFVLVAIGAALVVSVRAAWQRVVVRVAGSWVAAVGLLMLGWALKKT